MTTFIQLLSAFVGSLGFCLLFGLRRKLLFPAALGGLLAWAVYLATENALHISFVSNLFAAGFSVLWADVMARILRNPTTLFLTPAILPLVPGGTLYEAMSYAVRGDAELAKSFGSRTLNTALAIAAGICIMLAWHELRPKNK